MACSGQTSSHMPQKMQRIMSISNSRGYFSTLLKRSFAGISPGSILMARGGQMNSQSWQATQRMRPASSFTKAGAPRKCSGSCESHFSSGYCMVTLVRPRSIFLKCRSVVAIPATIAGKYNRSDQVSFGRGTVIAISTPAPARNHNPARPVSITMSSQSGDCHIQNGTTVMCRKGERRRLRIRIRLGLSRGLSVEKGDDGGGAENVHERDLEKENPAQPHQLIVAKTRQSEADPDKHKKKRRNFGEENENVNQTKNPSVGTVRDAGKMPAPKEKGNDYGGAGEQGSIFPEEKERELH